MPVSPRLELPYPVDADENDVPADIVDLVNAIDSNVAGVVQGVYSSRPPAGKGRRFFWATDYRLLFYDDGAQWQEIIRSAAWTNFTPTFVALNGNGTVITSVTPAVSNLEARYRLVAAGTQCEIYLNAKIGFTGTPPTGQYRIGLRFSLPVPSLKTWVLDGDCGNDIARVVAHGGGSVGSVFYAGSANFALDGVARDFRITGVYEVTNPGGIGGDVPETPPDSSASPNGPAGGDLEQNYPNPKVKDSAVRRHRLDQMAKPTDPLDFNSQKGINTAPGESPTDIATMANLAALQDYIEENFAAFAGSQIVVSSSQPSSQAINDFWFERLNN